MNESIVLEVVLFTVVAGVNYYIGYREGRRAAHSRHRDYIDFAVPVFRELNRDDTDTVTVTLTRTSTTEYDARMVTTNTHTQPIADRKPHT